MGKQKTMYVARRKFKRIGIVVVVVLLLLSIDTIAVRPLPNSSHAGDKYEVLLMEESEEKLILLLRDDTSLYGYYQDLTDENGSLNGPYEVQDCLTAYIRDGVLKTVCLEEYVTLKEYVPENDFAIRETQNKYFIQVFSDQDFFAFSGDSDLFVAKPGVPLRMYDRYDIEDPVEISDICDVEFLDTTPKGVMYVYANGILYRWAGSDYENREAFYAQCPEKLIGEESFVDAAGNIYVINGDELCQVSLDEDHELNPYGSYGSDTELYVPGQDQMVYQFDWYGTLIDAFSIEGNAIAVTPGYALIKQDDSFYLQKLVNNNEGEETPDPGEDDPASSDPPPEEIIIPTLPPTPTPDPTPDPTEKPDPNETPIPDETEPSKSPDPENPDFSLNNKPLYELVEGEEGTYVLLLAGTRAEELRELKKPQAIKITEEDGSPVYAGKLKTGMKMDDYTIVIRGDCNNTGKVTPDDIYFVQECLIEVRYFQTETEFIAADMDQNGVINTLDTIYISAEIFRNRSIF